MQRLQLAAPAAGAGGRAGHHENISSLLLDVFVSFPRQVDPVGLNLPEGSSYLAFGFLGLLSFFRLLPYGPLFSCLIINLTWSFCVVQFNLTSEFEVGYSK